MRHCKFTILLLLIPLWGLCQNIAPQWLEPVIFTSIERDYEVTKIIQAFDETLIVVGASTDDNKNQDGFVIRLDSESGQEIGSMLFFGDQNWDETIEDIVQIEDGGFYLLINKRAKNKSTTSYLLRTDEQFSVLEQELDLGALHLTKMLYQQNKQILLFGKDNPNSGYISIIKYLYGQSVRSASISKIGEGKYDELKAATVNDKGEILLCGTTKSIRKKLSGGKVWLAKIKDGKLLNKKLLDSEEQSNYNDFKFATVNFDGKLILAGGKYGENWLMEVNDQLEYKVQPHALGAVFDTDGALMNYESNYLLFSSSRAVNKFNPIIEASSKDEMLYTETGKQMLVRDILFSFNEQYIVVGTTYINKKQAVKLMSLKARYDKSLALGSKGSEQLSISITNPRLEETSGNNNGILEKGERAAIVFDLHNTGDEPLKKLKLRLKSLSSISGVNFFEERIVSYLGVDKKRSIPVPFNTSEGFSSNQDIQLRAEVLESNNTLNQIEFTIRTYRDREGTRMKIFYEEGTPARSRSSEEYTELKLNLLDENRQLKRESVTIYKNGEKLDDTNKSGQGNWTTPAMPAEFLYTLSQRIPLDTGINKIYFEVIDETGVVIRSPEIERVYYPTRPNLHVLAIGIPHDDLQFTTKDASDFAEVMRLQKGKSFYEEVYVKELSLRENTDMQSIQIAFGKIFKRYTNDNSPEKILPNDVLVIFISSHGEVIDGKFKIKPSNFDKSIPNYTSVDYEKDILKGLDKINCKKLVFIDACHSGAAKSGDDTSASSKELLRLNDSKAGLSILNSCDEYERSFEDSSWSNGAFTEALLEAFHNKEVTLKNDQKIFADTSRNGKLSLEEIYEFVRQRVPYLVDTKLSKNQNPILSRQETQQSIDFFDIIQRN